MGKLRTTTRDEFADMVMHVTANKTEFAAYTTGEAERVLEAFIGRPLAVGTVRDVLKKVGVFGLTKNKSAPTDRLRVLARAIDIAFRYLDGTDCDHAQFIEARNKIVLLSQGKSTAPRGTHESDHDNQ